MSKWGNAIRRWTKSPCLRSFLRRFFRCTEHIFAIIGFVFVVYHLCFELSVMTSDSMSPTIQGTSAENGDWVLTEKVSFWFRNPRRWETIALINSEGIDVIKRVVGLPGEDVSIVDHGIVIDGALAPRPSSLDFLKYYAVGKLRQGATMACKDGYCVLGDHSTDSQDSRYDGAVSSRQIKGRAWLIIRPFSRLRFLNP